jgi:hypothetical protein
MALVRVWQELPAPTLNDEITLIQLLGAAAALVPESEINGTPQYRIFVVGQHGELNGSRKKERHPLVFEVADMISKYMGAGDGRWKEDHAFDVYPNNVVSMFKNVSSPWLRESVQQQLWNYGVVYARSESTTRYFYPAFSGIYPDETSILSSMINSLLCMSMEKVHFRTWTRIVGGALAPSQIVQQANLSVQNEVRDKYGARFSIAPNAFLDENDIENGKSYHLNIDVYGNNPRVRFTYRATARRMSDLQA